MKSDEIAEAKHFRPNWRAYVALALVTVVLAAMWRLGMDAVARLGDATLLGISRPTLVTVELVLCIVAWLYVAEHLLRRYQADRLGLTVYRSLLPPLRYGWDQVQQVQVYGHGDVFRLTVRGRGHLLVMLECLQSGSELAGYIQSVTCGSCTTRR